ncbi:MAG TPA: hypothetical protein VIM90_00110 [Arenimonas sp.]
MNTRSRKPGSIRPVLLFLLGFGLAAGPALAAADNGYVELPEARELLASLGVQGPVVAYADYPFPDVPEGELWRPEADYWQEVTAVVPSGNSARYPEAARKILAEALALANAGQGVAATALLERHASEIPDGMAYRYLAWIHQYGKGDQPADRERAVAYALRLAEYNPAGYLWLGEWQVLPKPQRLHYLSKGLSRGCRGCARWLIESKTSGKGYDWHYDVPHELRLRYAMFAVEIGDAAGPRLLDSVAVELSAKKGERKASRGIAPGTIELAAMLMQEAYRVAGTDKIYGVRAHTYAPLVSDRIRSGLVPGDLLEALALAEAGDPTKAATQLMHNQARGLLFSRVANRVMKDATLAQVGEPARLTLAIAAAEWGDPYRWAAAGLAERNNLGRIVKSGGALKVQNGAGVSEATREERAKSFTALALASPATPAPIRNLLMSVESRTAATRSAGNVRECLERVMASNHPPSMLFTCEGMITWAWENTNEVDFGVLSDDWFNRLAQQAGAVEAATLRQRRNDAVDARLGALNAERDAEDRRLAASGLARVPLNSQQALTQAREDVAWANQGASAQAAKGVPSYQGVIARLHRGFINKRNGGSAAGGDAVRQALNDAATSEVCADWGYRYFAECPNRRP